MLPSRYHSTWPNFGGCCQPPPRAIPDHLSALASPGGSCAALANLRSTRPGTCRAAAAPRTRCRTFPQRGYNRACVCPPRVTVGSVAAYLDRNLRGPAPAKQTSHSGLSARATAARRRRACEARRVLTCPGASIPRQVYQPFSVKLPGEFGCAPVAALHLPATLLKPPAHLLLPFIAFVMAILLLLSRIIPSEALWRNTRSGTAFGHVLSPARGFVATLPWSPRPAAAISPLPAPPRLAFRDPGAFPAFEAPEPG